jgi:hypothetical protein
MQEIAERIAKLLALSSDKAATEGEARAAALAARRLMDRHEIGIEEVEAAAGRSRQEVVEEPLLRSARRLSMPDEMIVDACCTLVDCCYYFERLWDCCRYVVYGRRSRVAVAVAMVGALRKSCRAAARAVPAGKRRRHFSLGWSTAVLARARKAAEAKVTTGEMAAENRAALVRTCELERHAAGMNLSASPDRRTKIGRPTQAHLSGYHAGSRESLRTDGLPEAAARKHLEG